MVEVAKPDYLSLVNQGGSGFNISELVTAMVAAEIEPKRVLHTDKKTVSENAISGIGLLSSQSFLTQSSFDSLQNDSYFSVSSSDESAINFSSSDEMKLEATQVEVSNVQLAKKMVFELPGFTDLEATISQAISIDFGTWSQTSSASSLSSNSVEAGKTYKVVTRADGADGDAFDEFTRDPNDPNATTAFHGVPIEVGDVFRAPVDGDDSGYTFQEVDAYAFTEKTGNTTVNLALSGTLENVVNQLDGVSGISAKLVQTSSDSSSTDTYSIVITSEDTGLANAFKISASGSTRWETTGSPVTNSDGNQFSQLSRDATLDIDNVSISRSSNSIDNVIDGITVNLKSDSTSPIQLNVTRSNSSVETSVKNIIISLNEFRTQLETLTFINVEGDENGPLAMDPAVTRIKSDFKKLSVEPLTGYGDNDIYLSQLGIKTNENGEFYLDEETFDKTWAANPEYFNALKDNNLSSSSSTATLSKSQYTVIPAGSYTVENDGTDWKFGSETLTRTDHNGGSRFSTSTYPGLTIDTTETNPTSFTVYVGQNFSEKVSEFMETILDTNSSLNSAEIAYSATSTDLTQKLKDLEDREELITTRYTTQFGAMEQAMTQFNSTKSLLENFMEAWKKEK